MKQAWQQLLFMSLTTAAMRCAFSAMLRACPVPPRTVQHGPDSGGWLVVEHEPPRAQTPGCCPHLLCAKERLKAGAWLREQQGHPQATQSGALGARRPAAWRRARTAALPGGRNSGYNSGGVLVAALCARYVMRVRLLVEAGAMTPLTAGGP